MRTILYVDDEPINLKLFELNLRRHFIVHTANNAAEGIEMLNKNPDICVVVSDMRMPGMNGIDFIKKSRETRPDIKYFILTGYAITGEIMEALEGNIISEYFSKPFKAKEVIDVINSSLGVEP